MSRMDKAHDVRHVSLLENRLSLTVDGKRYEVDLGQHSKRLALATAAQRANFVVSPTGYGIHWPDLDEDLSIDALVGIAHECPLTKPTAG